MLSERSGGVTDEEEYTSVVLTLRGISGRVTSDHNMPDAMGLLLTYLPNLVTSVPTIKEPTRPPIANTETVREYMSVRASSFSPVPLRLTTVRL